MNRLAFAFTFIACVNAQAASACPDFDPSSRYTEVVVACIGSVPEFSQRVAVNQPDEQGQGGECRVATGETEYFLVKEMQLYWYKGRQAVAVGTLNSTPYCYQTDSNGEYYSSWNSVKLALAQ
jgi:hypothetical protein